MKLSRRNFLTNSAMLAGGAALAPSAAHAARRSSRWDKSYSGGSVDVEPLAPGLPDRDYRPVVVPNGYKVPFKIVDGVKVFHMVVEEFQHELMPGLKATMWGYNGHVNGVALEAVEGERIRVYVTNKLRMPTSVHWHGLYLPNGMDGVSGLTQPPIGPGETFKYEWTLRQHGTYMFHSHYDTMTQEGMGLSGLFIIHPRNPSPDDLVDRDFAILLNEYAIEAGTARPNPNENSDFNVLTMNGKIFPAIDPLVAKLNDRVRIRLGNLSAMDHHPIHLHGYRFKITATDGERIPPEAQWPETTALVAVGQTREVELIADAPGDWAMHCHMTHHIMNQMGHGFPNMVGIDPAELDRKVQPLLPAYMTMGHTGMEPMGGMAMPENSVAMAPARLHYSLSTVGGMFTVFKVREHLATYDEDPGWYRHPEGTLAGVASAEDLARDGVDVS